MKKKLFLALLTTLLLLLAATTALAVSPSDYNCPSCGEPCTGWFPYRDDTTSVHAPYCSSCGVMVGTATFPCTPAEGTATCMDAALCSVCGSPDWLGSAPDPNAHDWGDWEGFSASTHIRVCRDCGAEEEAPHSGGDGSCWTECEDCGTQYNDANGEHRNMSDWFPYSGTQHFRYCMDCDQYEYANHHGGDGSCTPVCADCSQLYSDENGEHRNVTDWIYINNDRHFRYCPDCGSSSSYEYADHSGGEANCTEKAVCEGCGEGYGELAPDDHDWGEWKSNGNGTHTRTCKNDVTHTETEDCTGSDGSCRPTCEDCGNLYSDLNGEHRNMSDWTPFTAAQHTRYCLDCMDETSYEYADHTGGDGTCQPICEECGAQYTNKSGKHLYMSEWVAISDTQHSRYCLDCYTYEYADHTGSDGTCRPTCEVCEFPYPDLNGQHLHMSVWEGVSDTQHARICTDCYRVDSIEYGNHSGGTATCSTQAVCEDCGMAYGSLDNTRHGEYSGWTYHNENQHSRHCQDCSDPSSIVYEDHYGGTATCNAPAICEGCGAPYGEVDSGNHIGMTDWVPYSYEQHYRACMGCASPDSYEFEDHSGGTATCTEDGVCQVCKAAYIPALQHTWGEWKPNTDGTHTRTCDHDPTHTETADCTWGDWTHLTHIHHERRCSDCNGQELGEHTGGILTCYSPRICDVCNAGYGPPDNSGLSGHPNPVIELKPATCHTDGYYRVTCDHPGCSAPFTEFIFPATGPHIYNDWQPTGEGSHIAACCYCGEALTVPCTVFTAELFAACPICGVYEGGVLEVIHARDDDMVLPYGTLVIRGGANPADGVLCAITVAGSYGGNVVDLLAPATINVPVDATGFRVVDMDGQDIPFTLENGVLTFKAAKAGLFLLIPAE